MLTTEVHSNIGARRRHVTLNHPVAAIISTYSSTLASKETVSQSRVYGVLLDVRSTTLASTAAVGVADAATVYKDRHDLHNG